uniref:Uncharacterized protein n=1 Tax=Nelumbo nucifera TaxID=4432 RepID=A0A822XNE4_NELNU|nr:TPA_asm: hypothetical protein HUJ06_022687 [Nelumbo nucifera]
MYLFFYAVNFSLNFSTINPITYPILSRLQDEPKMYELFKLQLLNIDPRQPTLFRIVNIMSQHLSNRHITASFW